MLLAVLQIPATSLSAKIQPAKLLVLSTVITAPGWLLAGLAGSGIALGAALVVAGGGASVQHPIASCLVSRAYGKAAKRPLGLYNFDGDVGKSFMLTEVATAVLIVAVLLAPLTVAMLVLPLLGVVLNGPSSVLYGAVTDVVEAPRLEKAFSIFHTGTIGSGALAPVLYGYVGDHADITVAVTVITITAAVSFLPVTVMAARHRDLFEQPR